MKSNMVTQILKKAARRCSTGFAVIYRHPLCLAWCAQVAQFDMSGQDLSLSQLSVDTGVQEI